MLRKILKSLKFLLGSQMLHEKAIKISQNEWKLLNKTAILKKSVHQGT